jgi:hypothetical protein
MLGCTTICNPKDSLNFLRFRVVLPRYSESVQQIAADTRVTPVDMRRIVMWPEEAH